MASTSDGIFEWILGITLLLLMLALLIALLYLALSVFCKTIQLISQECSNNSGLHNNNVANAAA
ncbi:unnamed protein product [Coffea canephora]|uniref:Uncharacterized protein n=1 Tax=Coffea canephora TaxID=49390 RepID=A0A068TVD2_COFCA|nr:unnamed protein product [Coffea canephora]